MVVAIQFATPEYDEAVALRDMVLRRPLGLQFSVEQLAAEWSDTHLGYFGPSAALFGCLIMTPVDEKLVKMRQVAVHPDMQHQGIGMQLVSAAEEWAKSAGFERITLHARDTAIPFYLHLNYVPVGEEFTEVGIPHREMEKAI